MIPSRVTYVSLSQDHFARNIETIRALMTPKQSLCAVVKGDAYGHGASLVVPKLADMGVLTFALSRVDEALWIRQAYPAARLIVLCEPLGDVLDAVLTHRLEPCLNSPEDVVCFFQNFKKFLDTGLKAHFKIDTGMGRLGLAPRDLMDLCDQKETGRQFIAAAAAANAANAAKGTAQYKIGLMSHFAMSEDAECDVTRRQIACFDEFVTAFAQKLAALETHISNTGAVLNGLAPDSDLVRIGIGLFGGVKDARLKPVLAWRTRALSVRHVPAGAALGYAHTFTPRRPTRVAVLPVGYRLGYDIRQSNRGVVRLVDGGHQVPVIGRVSMDLTLVDVTDVPLADERLIGAEVSLISNAVEASSPVHIHYMAEQMGTISYELLCQINNDVERGWE